MENTTTLKSGFNESAALFWFQGLGYTTAFGPDIAPDGRRPERESYNEPILPARLRQAIEALNPGLPPEAREEACRKVLHPASPSLIVNNRLGQIRVKVAEKFVEARP